MHTSRIAGYAPDGHHRLAQRRRRYGGPCRGRWLWRLSFFRPYLLASTVVVMFWRWMYNPTLG